VNVVVVVLMPSQEGAGFIAEDSDEEDEDRAARRKRKKRKNRELDETLDEEDLDLIGLETEPRDQQQVSVRIQLSKRLLMKA
jgi:hypothetical protein